MNIERRFVELDRVETRNSDDEAVLYGHAAIFDTLSEDLGGFREKIAPGAFSEAIKSDDVRALFNHDPNYILARNRAGTLELSEDATGLAVEITLPDTSYARDLRESIQRGDVSQMSFGFMTDKGGQEWDEDSDGRLIRTITRASLFDVSPVTYPAYHETDIQARGLEAARESFEAYVKERQSTRDRVIAAEMRARQIHVTDLIDGLSV